MPNFDKYSNYNPETPFDSIIFGSDSMLLETELNEMQEIIQGKIKQISSVIGDYIGWYASTYPKDTDEVSIELLWGMIEGFPINLSFMEEEEEGEKVFTLKNNQILVLSYKLKTATKDTPLTLQNLVGWKPVENKLVDKRYNVETSRRSYYELEFIIKDGMTVKSNEFAIAFRKDNRMHYLNTSFYIGDDFRYMSHWKAHISDNIGTNSSGGYSNEIINIKKSHGINYKKSEEKLQVLITENGGYDERLKEVITRNKTKTIEILSTNWVASSNTGSYKFKNEIEITGIKASDVPTLNYNLATIEKAEESGASFIETVDGGLIVYAKEKPTENLTGELLLVRGGAEWQ